MHVSFLYKLQEKINNVNQCENLPLRLPHRNDAKIAKIRNLWTFWPVIQPINHLFKIRQKGLFLDSKKTVY